MYYVAIMEGDGDVWSLRVPDLPGVHGAGPTPEAAIADTISAAREWADYQTTRGVPVRSPRSIQEVMADPDAEFNAAAGEALVMIPLELGATGAGR